MDIRCYNQPKDTKLGDILNDKLKNEKFDDVWIVSGFAKDLGIDVLIDGIRESISNGSNVNVIIGIDKKNTSKDMLMRLLNNGCKVKVHTNTDKDKFETRVYIFKRKIGKSFIYLSSGKLSEGGLLNNISLITEIIYNESEFDKLEEFITNVIEGLNDSRFKNINIDDVISLAESGEIVARIIDRKIPSISDIYKKDIVEIGVQHYDEGIGVRSVIDKSNLEDVDFDVSLPIEGEVKIKNSLGKEVEQSIKPIKKKKIQEEESKINIEDKKTKIIINANEPNFKNMNTFLMQINKISQKGVGVGEIKIPHSISDNMNMFLDYPNNFHMIEDKNGKIREIAKIFLEIVDNKNIKNVENDDNATFIQMDKYLAIKSNVLNSLQPSENDIIRIIKIGEGKFKFELIRENTEEYLIWEGFCTNKIKGCSRRYGVI